MNKLNQNRGSAGDGMSPETITETMTGPGFTPEHLPELWRHVAAPDTKAVYRDRLTRWKGAVEVLFRRCETYPQSAKLSTVLGVLPYAATSAASRAPNINIKLVQQATPELLLQALACERLHPGSRWSATDHILSWVDIGQLTGPVIEQLPWRNHILLPVTSPTNGAYAYENVRGSKRQHVVEHIKQQMLGGGSNAWIVFQGIVEHGTVIGEAAALAVAIEHQNRPSRHGT